MGLEWPKWRFALIVGHDGSRDSGFTVCKYMNSIGVPFKLAKMHFVVSSLAVRGTLPAIRDAARLLSRFRGAYYAEIP